MPGSRRSRGQWPGRSKKCARNIFISLWWRRAGSMTPILPRGPAQFFKAAPMPFRPIMQSLVGRKVEKTLKLQRFGRHTRAERDALAIADTRFPFGGQCFFGWAKNPAGRMRRSSPSSRAFSPRCSTRKSVPRRSVTPTSPPIRTGSRGFIFRIRRPNRFLRQAPPNRRGPKFSVPANVESRRKVLLTERAFRVPVRAGLQGRQ